MRHTIHAAWITGIACAVLSQGALAQGGAPKGDGRRPVGLISRDLGVTPQQFSDCFSGVSPAPQGERPTGERVHANKRVLLGCLQRANPAITNDSLDAVMDRYRPGGREAQRPER